MYSFRDGSPKTCVSGLCVDIFNSCERVVLQRSFSRFHPPCVRSSSVPPPVDSEPVLLTHRAWGGVWAGPWLLRTRPDCAVGVLSAPAL